MSRFETTDVSAFELLIQRNKALAWHNQSKKFDVKLKSGIFISPNMLLSDEKKGIQLRNKHMLDVLVTLFNRSLMMFGCLHRVTHSSYKILAYPIL